MTKQRRNWKGHCRLCGKWRGNGKKHARNRREYERRRADTKRST